MRKPKEEPKNPVLSAILEERHSKSRRPRPDLSSTIAEAQMLLLEGDQAHEGIPNDARNLLLDQIEPDPLQPRRRFAQEELKSLADDINRRGVLLPILVRPPKQSEGKYRIISGERRWRACLMVGKTRIPARIRDMSDEEVQEAQLAENIQRKNLSDIEKGRALRRLYELRKARNSKVTWEDVATEVGLGRARIHDLYHLASLPDEITALIESGRLSGSHGTALYRVQEMLEPAVLKQFADAAARPDSHRNGGYQMSVSHLRNILQEHLQQQQTPQPLPTSRTEITEEVPVPVTRVPHPLVAQLSQALLNRQISQEDRRTLLELLQQP